MRALFLTLYPDIAASPRYRVTQFVPHLESQGIQCDIASAVSHSTYARRRVRRPFWYHLEEIRRRMEQIAAARRYDVVLLQKALTSFCARGLMRHFHTQIPRYLYDMDDAVHLAPPNPVPRRWAWLTQPDQALDLMRHAYRVLAGNTWLADTVRSAGGEAEHFPTVVDTGRFVPAPSGDGAFRLGWIGSPSTAPSLESMAPILDSLRDVELHVMGAANHRVFTNVHAAPWTLESEVPFVQRLSAGLLPLPKDEWTLGKCALKALQYMACGVPCIATPYGAVTAIIEDGVNGLFADSPAEWHEAIERLRDPGLRESMGMAARATVEARYSLRYAGPRMESILRETAATKGV